MNSHSNPPTHPVLPYVATPFLPYVRIRILFDSARGLADALESVGAAKGKRILIPIPKVTQLLSRILILIIILRFLFPIVIVILIQYIFVILLFIFNILI